MTPNEFLQFLALFMFTLMMMYWNVVIARSLLWVRVSLVLLMLGIFGMILVLYKSLF